MLQCHAAFEVSHTVMETYWVIRGAHQYHILS